MKSPVFQLFLKMKVFLFTLLFIFGGLNAQDYYLELQEIIHDSKEGYAEPLSFRAGDEGGEMEFQIDYRVSGRRCSEIYRFSWSFDQEMRILKGINSESKVYGFDLRAERIEGNCGEIIPWRNPFVEPSAEGDGGVSRIMKSPGYKELSVVYTFKTEMEPKRLYFRQDEKVLESSGFVAGHNSGAFIMEQHAKYDGRYTYFSFDVSGTSNSSRYKDTGLKDEIIYLYKIHGGIPPASLASPSSQDIVKPDCSCCPGTIPVWNFDTNRAECLCPEGKTWSRIEQKCLSCN